MARAPSDTASEKLRGGRAVLRPVFAGAACAILILGLPPGADAANRVRISGVSDVGFGSISSLAVDSVQSQNLCVYAKSPPANNYSITASGSGPGGAFVLSSASGTLPFQVQWSDAPGQTSGSQLLANQPLAGQHSAAGGGGTVDDCSSGPASTATLIVILRSTAIGAALSGTYTGTLSLLVAPE